MTGEIFRKKREEAGLSLREVADNLRIQYEYLKALEEGNLRKLPPEVYTRGYIRDYARLLNLNPESLLAEYSGTLSVKEPPSRPEVPAPKKDFRLSPFLIGFFFVLIAGFSLFFLYPTGKTYSPPLQAPALIPTDTESPKSLEKTPPPPPPSGKPPVNIGEKRYHKLSIIAFEKTWLIVESGGGNSEEVILHSGDTKEWSSSRGFVVKLGNAGGVKVIFNEKDLGSLGQHGQVVKLVLPPQGQE